MRKGLVSWMGVAAWLFVGVEQAMAGASNTIRLSNSARQAAMGGTCRALEADGITPLCNPAAISFAEGAVFQSNGGLLITHTTYEDPQNDSRSGGETGAGVNGLGDFGFIQQLPDSPIGYGIGLYTYSGLRLKYDINSTLLTASGSERSSYDVTLVHSRVIPTLSLKVTDHFSIGGGYVAAYQTYAQAQPLYFSSQAEPASLAGSTGYIDADTDGWGHGGVFGSTVKFDEKTTLGASYTTKMVVKCKGKSELTFRNNPHLIASGIFDKDRANYTTSVSYEWPQVASLGISHRLRENVLFAFDWQWFDWSRAGDSLPLVLSEGNNPTVNAVAIASGSNGGVLRESLKLDLRDVFTYQFGGEWKVKNNLALRAGYVFATNPIPEHTAQPLVDIIIQHTVSLGAGMRVRGWETDVAWAHSFYRELVVERSDVEGGEFNNSQIGTGADLFMLSFTKRF